MATNYSYTISNDNDTIVNFPLTGAGSVATLKFLHKNRERASFQEDSSVTFTKTPATITATIPASTAVGYGEKEFYRITADGEAIFEGDIYVQGSASNGNKRVPFAKVSHGSNATYPRPNADYVLWQGSVVPVNATASDDYIVA